VLCCHSLHLFSSISNADVCACFPLHPAPSPLSLAPCRCIGLFAGATWTVFWACHIYLISVLDHSKICSRNYKTPSLQPGKSHLFFTKMVWGAARCTGARSHAGAHGRLGALPSTATVCCCTHECDEGRRARATTGRTSEGSTAGCNAV
jgi:hypothetical protein